MAMMVFSPGLLPMASTISKGERELPTLRSPCWLGPQILSTGQKKSILAKVTCLPIMLECLVPPNMEVSKRKIKHVLITEEGEDCGQNQPLSTMRRLWRNCLHLGTMLPDYSGHKFILFFDMLAFNLGKATTFPWGHTFQPNLDASVLLCGIVLGKNTQKGHPPVITFSTESGKVPLWENMFRDRTNHLNFLPSPSVTSGLNLQGSTVEFVKKTFSRKCVILYELSISLYLSRTCGFS